MHPLWHLWHCLYTICTGQGSVTCPGAVAATPVESPIDVVEGLMGSDMPLAYYFGHLTPSDNPALYRSVS